MLVRAEHRVVPAPPKLSSESAASATVVSILEPAPPSRPAGYGSKKMMPGEAALVSFFRCSVCGRSLLDCVPETARDGEEVICPDGDHTGKSVREWRENIRHVTSEVAAAVEDEV